MVCKTGPDSAFVWLSLAPDHQPDVLSTYIFLINIFLVMLLHNLTLCICMCAMAATGVTCIYVNENWFKILEWDGGL